MKINVNEIQFKFKLRDNVEMPATMTMIIGQFEIRGFRIMKSKFEENKTRYVLFPPASRSGRGKWIQLFWTEIKDDWKLVEERAIAQFESESISQYVKNSADQLVNIEDIKL